MLRTHHLSKDLDRGKIVKEVEAEDSSVSEIGSAIGKALGGYLFVIYSTRLI